jgi:outer membrane immunogenic protein
MKWHALGTVAIAALCISAGQLSAADVETDFVAESDWTGAYIGVHVGYGDADYKGGFRLDPSDNTEAFAEDLELNGILGGVHIGYNLVQFNNIVLGVEADVSFMDWSDSVIADNIITERIQSESINGEVDLLASLRARLGFATSTALLYLTGGAAYAKAEYGLKRDAGDPPFSESVDLDDFGVVVGGGIEIAVSERVNLRAEGLYYNFDEEIFEPFGDCDGDECGRSLDGDFIEFDDVVVGRVGVSLEF